MNTGRSQNRLGRTRTPRASAAERKMDKVELTAEYQEHHFQGSHDVGVAWNGNRIWVCLDGAALFRAKMMDKRLFIEFSPPETIILSPG